MKGFDKKRFTLFLIGIAPMVLCSCGPTAKDWNPGDKSGKVFTVARRQLAPQPVYNRTRWVFPPELVYPRNIPESGGPLLLPVLHFELLGGTLEEASKMLAGASNYTSFCVSSLAKKKISLNALGTMEELADQIAKQAKIEVVVDHKNKHISFLTRSDKVTESLAGNNPVQPKFAPLVRESSPASGEAL